MFLDEPQPFVSLTGAPLSGPLRLTMHDIDERYLLKDQWTKLQKKAIQSYFTSWSWIEVWLDLLPISTRPVLLRFWRGSELIGLGIVVRRRYLRNGIVHSRSLYLHETGSKAHDQIMTEYNGFVVKRGEEQAVMNCFVGYFSQESTACDEMHLGGLDQRSLTSLKKSLVGTRLIHTVTQELACCFVDLTSLRHSGQKYLETLGKNTRYRVRRSQRELANGGPIEITRAQDTPEALLFLEKLIALHQHCWTERGDTGAFHNPTFARFHTEIVRRRYHSGEIDLLRVTAGGSELGFLYNFVWKGRVYYYQSGISYGDGKLQPGLVCHVRAIEYYLERGLEVYDFLAGDARYKRSLSNRSTLMYWNQISKPKAKFRVEAFLRRAKAGIRGLPRKVR